MWFDQQGRHSGNILVVDVRYPRAEWIQTSHDIHLFAKDIRGSEILARQRASVERYGARIIKDFFGGLQKQPGGFTASIHSDTDEYLEVEAKAGAACHRRCRYQARLG